VGIGVVWVKCCLGTLHPLVVTDACPRGTHFLIKLLIQGRGAPVDGTQAEYDRVFGCSSKQGRARG